MSKCSPGTWHVEPEQWTHGRREVVCTRGGKGEDSYVLAIILPEHYDEYGEPNITAQDKANARTMAAAKELLQACKAAKASLALENPVQFSAWQDEALFEMLSRAIAKTEEE